MVCVLEETDTMCQCAVQDLRNSSEDSTDTTALFQIPGSTKVSDFLQTVASRFKSAPNTFRLSYTSPSGIHILFTESSTETLLSIGLQGDICNTLVLGGKEHRSIRKNKVGGLKEQNSLPTENYPTYNMPPPPAAINSSQHYAYTTSALIKQDTGYVGLVNQAMTCYLNSLLQALYMTPEFRNALYNWQYDPKKDSNNPGKCIPYQLQRLFLNLQTSHRTAVETTELTRSFGWDSSEAWQQHDIQELCRVMFDALEQTFRDTKQADLIDRLYQGKMIDYVKCLECSKEKSREDTFLDIPLPVRPFGSTVAYGSVEDALKAFVQPETLDGANQYFCESCAKKCDAHKGLKFKKFPYLLTLHLKRFDFDYSTMHRIKLNDKVAFPEILDLNELIEQELVAEREEGSEGLPEELTVSKCDDSSTTDSGSALDDEGCQGGADLPPVNACDLSEDLAVNKNGDGSIAENILSQEGEVCEGATASACDINQEDDEGIDISSNNGSNHQENEKNRQHGLNKGPHVYELFSIMIHSGSASGGHYYAYIKDFSNGEWFCFNDTSVTKITNDDISKTYGGGALRSYYSGAYSSSTNAYMLMYRQINENLNCDAMKIEEFPEHIKEVLSEMQSKQEKDRKFRDEMLKLKVYCQHPHKGMIDGKVFVHNDSTFEEVTSEAHNVFKLGGLVEESDCRLVSYNASLESIEMSYSGRERDLFLEVVKNANYTDLLLDIKTKDEEFISYEPGDTLYPLKPKSWLHWLSKAFVDLCKRLMSLDTNTNRILCPPLNYFPIYHSGSTIKVFVVDVEKDEVEPAFLIRSSLNSTVAELKESIADMPQVSIKAEDMVILMERQTNNYLPLEFDSATLKEAGFFASDKAYVCCGPLEKKPYNNTKVHALIDRFEHVITVHFTLPDTDPDTLAHMSIPSLSSIQAAASKQAGDASMLPPLEKVAVEPAVAKSGARGLLLPLILAGGGEEEGGGMSSGGAGGGHSDQSASEDSSLTDSDRTLIGDVQDECMSEGDNQSSSPPEEEANALPLQEECWDEEPTKQYTYFKAHPYESDSKKMLKVDVDKRMSLEALKSNLESFLGVPANCFKLYRSSDNESSRTRHVDSLKDVRSEEQLTIRLARELTSDEHKLKVYQLILNAPQPIKYLCDCIVTKGRTVGQSKKEIINEVNKRHNLNLQYDKCRLRKKNWKNVGRVYMDSQLWVDDVVVYSNGDVLLQELSEPETVTSTSQLSVFVRHWQPSTLTLGPFEELILDTFRIDDLKQKLSEKINVPVEHIDIAKPSGLFPCELSVLCVPELEWSLKVPSLESWPLQFTDDGGVLLYKDNREELKSLTTEERNELSTKETTRLNGVSGTINTYSPRKERPLKIYLDRRPIASGDADVD